MDAGKVSLILSFATLILALPLAVVANLLTPKVRDWWAANTGRPRLEKRIQSLRIAEASWCFTPAELELYQDSYWGRVLLLLGGGLLLYCVIMLLFLQLSSLGFSGAELLRSSNVAKPAPGSIQSELLSQSTDLAKKALLQAEGISPMLKVLNFILAMGIIWRHIVYGRTVANHSEEGRKNIRKQIDKLTAKLSPERALSAD